MNLTESSKVSAVVRLLVIAGLSGVLCSALVLPIVASSGILVRNAASKITATSLNVSTLPQRSAMYDRDGHLITYFYGVDEGRGETYTGIDRQPVDYSRISPSMLKAIVAIEDDRYWQHGAIDFQGTLRAVVNDAEGNAVQGGSTLVQQYVKGVLVLQGLDNPAAEHEATADNLSRKYDELRMALGVAHHMTKQQILAGYLNDSYFEQGAWGIEAAAETYFGTTAAKLTLTQAALLAGMVENPSAYDPLLSRATAVERRNTVLARMMQTGVLSKAAEARALTAPLGLQVGGVQSGCSAPTVGDDGFFCDVVVHTFLTDKSFGVSPADRARLLATGGLQIHTTISPQDETAATNAVNHVMPQWSKTYNPAHNAATEAMVAPGTGQVMAIAEDRPYGTGPGQTEVDYAVNSQDGGSATGVQTGSSSKLFTLITALQQGIPFGYTDTVPYADTYNGYTDCSGRPAGYNSANGQKGSWSLVNSSSGDHGAYSLYTATTESINTFYAKLELKVGLCNVVHTAADLGTTRPDGSSLLAADGSQPPADQVPSFTLGSVNVSPLTQANAYATVASSGIYCSPIVMTSVTVSDGASMPVPSADCHRVLSSEVANAVNYILQGVLTTGTASPAAGGPGVLANGYVAAGKTATSNVESFNGTPYAGFAGYTTNLASYTSVFNPVSPVGDTMTYQSACYRLEFGGYECPAEMYGANAPASIWHMSFDHASLGHARQFGVLVPSSELWSQGNGQGAAQPKTSEGSHTGGGRSGTHRGHVGQRR